MPSKNTVSQPRDRVGRRERECRREAEGAISPCSSPRNGERHPGFPEGGVLRGTSLEGNPRSVRALFWVSPQKWHRTDDTGCPKGAEEGNVVSMRHKAHALDGWAKSLISPRTRPSLGLSTRARRSSLCTAVNAEVWGGRSASRLGKPTYVGETSTGVGRLDVARLAACHSFLQWRGRDTFRKGRRSRSPSLRGSRVPVRLPARRVRCRNR